MTNLTGTSPLPSVRFALVAIEWEDSAQPRPAWEWLDEYELEKAIRCLSVGYVVAESAESIALAPNLGDMGQERPQASGIIRIPQSAIRRRVELEACRPAPAHSAAKPTLQAPAHLDDAMLINGAGVRTDTPSTLVARYDQVP
jgi:hypothetical protein